MNDIGSIWCRWQIVVDPKSSENNDNDNDKDDGSHNLLTINNPKSA